MTNLPQKEQIKSAINDYCKIKDLSKNEFATQTGVSSATLSKIENNKWEDIDEKLWRKIWNKINDNTLKVFQTNDYVLCLNACETAQKHKFMIGLIADTGMGKTTALTAYSLRKNVLYVSYLNM